MKAEWTNADILASSPITNGGSTTSSYVREQTLEERNNYLQDENSRLINEVQKLKLENDLLKDMVVELVKKMIVGK